MIIKNLGGITRAVDYMTTNGDGTQYGYWNNAASAAATAINAYLSPVTGETISASASDWFWSSSESSAFCPSAMHFRNDDMLNIRLPSKANTETTSRVRATLAF